MAEVFRTALSGVAPFRLFGTPIKALLLSSLTSSPYFRGGALPSLQPTEGMR